MKNNEFKINDRVTYEMSLSRIYIIKGTNKIPFISLDGAKTYAPLGSDFVLVDADLINTKDDRDSIVYAEKAALQLAD